MRKKNLRLEDIIDLICICGHNKKKHSIVVVAETRSAKLCKEECQYVNYGTSGPPIHCSCKGFSPRPMPALIPQSITATLMGYPTPRKIVINTGRRAGKTMARNIANKVLHGKHIDLAIIDEMDNVFLGDRHRSWGSVCEMKELLSSRNETKLYK